MAKRLQRIQVGKRIFGYKYGATWIAFKEYARNLCECGDSVDHHGTVDKQKCLSPGCECREYKTRKLLSFALGRPKIINHRTVKQLIAERIGWREAKCEETKKSKSKKSPS